MLQSQPDTFFHWFYTNAPAAWMSALIAVVTCLLVIRSKKKPRRIVVREVSNTSLVRIRPEVRHKIKMSFEDRPIKTVGQIEAEIFNEGSDVIHSPAFVLTVPPDSVVLDVLLTPSHLRPTSDIDGNRITITLPYLNPICEHSEMVKLSLVVDGETTVGVSGSGEGWSVRYLPLANPKREMYWDLGLALCVLALLDTMYPYAAYIEKKYGIGPTEMSWRVFVASLPVLVLGLLISGLWLARKVRRLRREMCKSPTQCPVFRVPRESIHVI